MMLRKIHQSFLIGIALICASTPTVVEAKAFFPLSKISYAKWSNGASSMKSRSINIPGDASHSSTTSQPSVGTSSALLVRGGEVSDIVQSAYDWCINLGNPSALVAGAVVATMYENIGSGALDIGQDDTDIVKFGKRLTRFLLLSAFALEVMSIFVTTVTGTMLMSKPEHILDAMVHNTKSTTPLSFLHDNFEFEYLTARITFLQGLLNWILAIALGHLIPGDESAETRQMNKFIGSSLLLSTCTLICDFPKLHLRLQNDLF